MSVNHNMINIRLSAAEIANLWTAYLADTASVCILNHFSQCTKDPDMKVIVDDTLSLAKTHIDTITKMFQTINHPIPHGFSKQDVNLKAKPLFTGSFVIFYLKYLIRFSMNAYSIALGTASRADVRDYFTQCIGNATQLSNRIDDLLLKKGLYSRHPSIPIPETAEYVHKDTFMTGFFGDKRPLNAAEIEHIFFNTQTNILGKALIMGFSQVVKSARIKNYFLRGEKISEKHIKILSDILQRENIHSPILMDTEIMDSTQPPFSDRLMMFTITTTVGFGIGLYGLALSFSARRDIALTFLRLIGEVGQFAEDGLEIMIDNGWLEKMPGAADRKQLVGV